MSPRQKRRMMVVALIVVGVGVATALTLTAFQQNLLYFITPTEVKAGALPTDKRFRIGGLVVEDSVNRSGIDVEFGLTDGNESVTVAYSGILPDLFREGQGIVALGVIREGGMFHADEVLAKHDEEYMPPEVADALKKANPETVNKMYKDAHGE
ncbi:MAG: cytochrome c maturation protein CcmE [Gammaproteobacteria bacterium]|nr:cytochrome c maturation protein CcmE [Gammaproteobacteria bacterium]